MIIIECVTCDCGKIINKHAGKVTKKYQCDICGTLYPSKKKAYDCEFLGKDVPAFGMGTKMASFVVEGKTTPRAYLRVGTVVGYIWRSGGHVLDAYAVEGADGTALEKVSPIQASAYVAMNAVMEAQGRSSLP